MPPPLRLTVAIVCLGIPKSDHFIPLWYIFRFYPVHDLFFFAYRVDVDACVFTVKRLLGTASHLLCLWPTAQGTGKVCAMRAQFFRQGIPDVRF